MPVADDKERVLVTLSKDEIEWIDAVAKRFRMTRSQVIGKCVADTREALYRLDTLGMTPEKMAAVVEAFYGMWNMVSRPVLKTGKKAKE